MIGGWGYPAGLEYDDRAPWNQDDEEDPEVEGETVVEDEE